MLNNNSLGKNVVAYLTIIATVVMTAGLSLMPIHSAQAAIPQGPALVKASSDAVYFLASDGKRYVFPNEKTYKTWYADFSEVTTITGEELASLPIGGNVVYRAGTRLVKITTDPKVYAVEPAGLLRHVSTEEVATGLFGADWANRVDDVPDAFFTNYKTGNPITTVTAPKGSVVSVDNETFYINNEGKAQKLVGENALAQNRFRANYTLSLSADAISSLETAEDITGSVSSLRDAAQLESGLTTDAVIVDGNVSVALSATGNPVAGNAIPSGAFYAPMLCLDVNNGTNQELKVEGISVRRIGILADANVTGVLVTDEDGQLHGSNVTFGESRASSTFSSEAIYVAVGQTEQVCINVNISNAVNTGTIGLVMDKAQDLRVVTSAGQVVIPSGNFPFQGTLQQIVAGAGALGEVNVSSRAISGGDELNPTEVDQGAKDVAVAKFRFQEVTGNEAVEINNLTFRNNGSAGDDDIENIRLVDQDNKTIATAARMGNNEINFVLNNLAEQGVDSSKVGPNGGYLIPEGQLRDLTLTVDTTVGSNSANRTLIFTIQEQNDIRILGTETTVGVTPSEIPGSAAPDTFPIGDNFNALKFREGNTSLSRATSSRAGKIARGANELELAKFDVNVFGEDIEIQSVDFAIRQNGAAGLDTGDFALSGTIKIRNHNGANIFSKTATDPTNYGQGCVGGGTLTITNNQIAGCGTGADGLASTQNLNTFYKINAGEIGKLVFVGDIHQNAKAQDSYAVVITGMRFRRISSNNFANQVVNIAGNTLAVDASSITSLENASFNPVNLVLGGGDQHVASFNLQVGSGEAHRVNSITVRACESADNVIDAADCANTPLASLNAVSNIKLMVDGVAIAPPFNISATTGFTASTNLEIPKNETKVVDVFAIVSTAFPQTFLGIGFDVNSAVGVDSQNSTDLPEVRSQALRILGAGVLDVEQINDGTINIPKLLHAGESDVQLFRFQVLETNNAEGLRIEDLYVGGKGLGNFTNFKLFRDRGALEQVGNSSTVNGGEVRFTGLNDEVEKGSVVTYVVTGSTNNAGSLNLANNVSSLGVTYLEYTGLVSGNQIVESGGIATAADDATDLVTVNDVASFENGDAIRIDWNNDGDFADNLDGVDETATFFVCELGNVANTIKLGTAQDCVAADIDILAIANFVANGRITKFAITSDVAQVEEVEPVIAVHPSAITAVQSIDAQVATFVIAASGPRPTNFNKIRVEVSGSYQINTTNGAIFGPRNFQLWRANASDGAKVVQIQTGVAELGFVPSGIDAPTVAANAAANATALTFAGGTTGRDFRVGDRITFHTAGSTCPANEIAANGAMGYRVTQASAGTTGSLTITPGLRAAVATNDVICALVEGNTTVNAAQVQGDTVITVADSATFAVGDIVTFVDVNTPSVLRNNGQGYRIIAIANGTSLTITPGLEAALATNDLVRGDGTPLLATDVPESGAVVGFNLPAGEQIGAQSSAAYAVVADTSTIKDAGNTGTSTLTVRIPGERAVENNTNGLHWSYTSTTQGVQPIKTISDSYPVNSFTNRY